MRRHSLLLQIQGNVFLYILLDSKFSRELRYFKYLEIDKQVYHVTSLTLRNMCQVCRPCAISAIV